MTRTSWRGTIRTGVRLQRGRRPTAWVAAFLLSVMVVVIAPSGAAADLPSGSFVFGGWVSKIVQGEDGSTYVAGSFKQEVKPTGSGLVVPSSGEGLPSALTYPKVVGDVWAVVSDGAGGWYIGGDFRDVGGQRRRGLAHILSDGSVDPGFHPEVSFEEPRFVGGAEGVKALALSGSTLYVGGRFGGVAGQTRQSLASIDTGTGTVTSWNPNPGSGSTILALAVEGPTLYVGGNFSEVAGQHRHGLAAFQAGNGTLDSWDPEPEWSTGFGARGITSIAPDGGTVYIGGGFSEVGGTPRKNLAAIDATTGSATSWAPEPQFGVLSLAVSGSTIYVGGEVEGGNMIGGQERRGLAAVSLATGQATSWNPEPKTVYGYPEVFSIAVEGSTVYVVGNFSEIGGAHRSDAAALGASTGTANAWNPNIPQLLETRGSVNYRAVDALAVAGSHVYIGGSFAGAGPPVAEIGGLARLDPDGALDTSWKGEAGGVVTALAPVGNTLYVGGSLLFELGGQQRLSVGAVNAQTGEATNWHAANGIFEALGTVRSIAATGSTVYVGSSGTFEVEGHQHYGLTALSAATGEAVAFPELEGGSYPTAGALVISGGKLYVGGTFAGVGGEGRNALAAIDLSDDSVTNWKPFYGSLSTTVDSLAVDDGTAYVSGSFSEAEGHSRECVASFSLAGGALEPFDPGFIGGGSCPMQIAPSGSTVYIGGNFDSFYKNSTSTERINLAALESSTGNVTAWEAPVPEAEVTALAVAGSHLLVGGQFQFIGDSITGPFAELSTGPSHVLSVVKSGSGTGTVTSVPAAIECGSECSASLPDGEAVTLTATPGSGSIFTGWSGGGCSGTGTCQLALGADTTITATFAAQSSGGGGGGGEPGGGGGGSSSTGITSGSSSSSGQPTSGGPKPSSPPKGPASMTGSTATVQGGSASIALQCAGSTSCSGTAKLEVHNGGSSKSSSRVLARASGGPLVIGSKGFKIGPGKKVVIKVPLTKRGKALVASAGKRGLKVTLTGTGLKSRVIVLKAK